METGPQGEWAEAEGRMTQNRPRATLGGVFLDENP